MRYIPEVMQFRACLNEGMWDDVSRKLIVGQWIVVGEGINWWQQQEKNEWDKVKKKGKRQETDAHLISPQ